LKEQWYMMNQESNVSIPIKINSPDIDLRAFFYLLSLGLFMVYSILSISFYQNSVSSFGLYIMKLCFVLLVIAELTNFEYRRFDILGIAFIAFIMIVTFIVAGNVWWRPLLWIVLFAFGARHIKFEKIAKISLIISTACFLFITLSSAAGIIPDYLDKTTHLGVTRHYLGFLYCLFPTTILFNIEALYIYLRKDKIKWIELMICLIIGYVFYRLCDTRLNFIGNVLLILGAAIVRYRQSFPQLLKKIFIGISKGLPWIFILCGLISIVLSFSYHSDISWMAKINTSLGNRLSFGRISYQRYGLSLFGQIIPMRGNGLSGTGVRGRSKYFYLDCLYVRFFQEYGVVLSLILIILLTVVTYKMLSQKKYYLVIILAVLATHAVVDDLILLPYYNTFWIVCVYFLISENKVKQEEENMKVCLVGSSGGHLTHLYMLKPFWKDKERFWVTFDKEDAKSLLKDEKMYPCYYPTNRSIKAFFINLRIAWKVLRKEKPDLIISSGAAVAVPFFYLGKMFGCKTVYIEVFDRIDKPTLTGKMVYPVTDRFIVEWEEMKKVYPKAINLGSIF
jgi:beta-1,4-N-acetylglucosaminyltransferase